MSGELDLGQVTVPHAGDVLADVLRGKILSGELAEGSALPPERTLVEQSGLSRATVRESLRSLQHEGLVATRRGRGGGSVVSRPTAATVADSLGRHLRNWRPGTSSLLEVRTVLEPWCAALAAERRTDEALDRIEETDAAVVAALDDLPRYLEANVAWHLAVADACGNDLVAAFMRAVSGAVRHQTDDAEFNTAEVRRTAVRAHHRITEAIRAGDPEAARRRMARHVDGYAEALAGPPP